MSVSAVTDPHAGQRLVYRGAAWTKARLAVILLHGRGGAPEDLLELADEWNVPDIAYLAPAAAGRTWYPESFLAPIDRNEPWLTSALRTVECAVGEIEYHGVPAERVAILGFSQGGCLGFGVRCPSRAALPGPWSARAGKRVAASPGPPVRRGCVCP